MSKRIAVLSLCLIFALPAVSSAVKDETLIIYYSFDEVKDNEVEDLSGKGNNGTLQGGAERTEKGKFGGAVSGSEEIPWRGF